MIFMNKDRYLSSFVSNKYGPESFSMLEQEAGHSQIDLVSMRSEKRGVIVSANLRNFAWEQLFGRVRLMQRHRRFAM